MQQPLVSVIIPMFNRECLIGEAITSILGQDYPQVELIVVDDGSTDGSASVVANFPDVIYIKQSNQGPAVARNTGVERARGELIAFLDSDDLWLPQKLNWQVEAWLQTAEPSLVIGHTRLRFSDHQLRQSGYSNRMLDEAFPAYLPSALLVSRKTFDEVGGFDPSLRQGQDTDWFFRAIEQGVNRVVVPEVVFEKRLQGDNITGAVKATRQSMMKLLHASLRRKRQR